MPTVATAQDHHVLRPTLSRSSAACSSGTIIAVACTRKAERLADVSAIAYSCRAAPTHTHAPSSHPPRIATMRASGHAGM